MSVRALWVASVMIVGWLVGLRRHWRRQLADAIGCVSALGLAYWQHPRIAPYIGTIWPDLDSAVRPVALIYLFVVLYGLTRILLELYVPRRGVSTHRRWLGGLITALEAGAIATLSLTVLPHL